MIPKKLVLVGAKCESCDTRGLGSKPGNYFGKAYDLPRWKRKPKCPNCKGKLTKLWEAIIPAKEFIGE